ncbi:hypothetical protein Ccar_16770 [Clostridium carboxidivorans P7]|uniref:ORF6N domain-containing protein n=1 Tax=Clostridium carboxidivorans TaxID=217159 RepID=UPI00064E73A2|nr:ORF6N domain-containing protein [Clostridium carboxidivorans]AKN32420.1 hypothetical protein Ccar_16770 [Clostridium carboxidivorans P7]
MSNLIPLEFKKQRIMTTKVLAEEYGATEKNIQDNFSNNKNRFVEGKHYFKLEGQQLKQFKNSLPDNIREPLKFAPQLILWTEKGAARHAKILDTDEAWEVYEALEETYFRVKEQNFSINQLSPELQAFKQIFDNMAKQELEQKQLQQELAVAKEETAAVKQEVQGIRDVIALNPNSWKADINSILSKIAIERGGTTEAYREVRNESYKLLNERAGAKLEIRLTNRRRKVLEETGSKSKANKVTKLDVIADDKRLTEVYIAIVKEMAIKYKVA